MEQKYKDAMVSNAQLYNEKTTLLHQVDALKDKYVHGCISMCAPTYKQNMWLITIESWGSKMSELI